MKTEARLAQARAALRQRGGTMSETLKHCPFAKHDSDGPALFGDRLAGFQIVCACGAQGPLENTEAEAIAAWNRRALPAETRLPEPDWWLVVSEKDDSILEAFDDEYDAEQYAQPLNANGVSVYVEGVVSVESLAESPGAGGVAAD